MAAGYDGTYDGVDVVVIRGGAVVSVCLSFASSFSVAFDCSTLAVLVLVLVAFIVVSVCMMRRQHGLGEGRVNCCMDGRAGRGICRRRGRTLQ